MKIIAVLCFAVGATLLFLAAIQLISQGWRPIDVTVFDHYYVVLPQYLLLIAGGLVAAGFVATLAPHP